MCIVSVFVVIHNFFLPFRSKNCVVTAVTGRKGFPTRMVYLKHDNYIVEIHHSGGTPSKHATVKPSCTGFLKATQTTELGDLRTVNLERVKGNQGLFPQCTTILVDESLACLPLNCAVAMMV